MSTTDSPAAPAAEPEHAWFREYEDGWEFLVPGGGVLRVPHDATDSDRPLHEQLQRFADGIKIYPDGARPSNVIEALARCIAEMPAIGKDKLMGKEGDSQSYHYRSIEAVASHAAMLFGKHCVVPKVHKTKRAVKEYTVRSGGLWTEDYLMVKYRLYGPGGKKDYITTGWFHALGRDNSDKGTNKAMTQAFKQMLVQTLVVGDNKDDPDSYSAESTAAAAGQAGQDEPPRPPTWDELGWKNSEDWDRFRQAVIDAIRRLTDNQDLTKEDASALWRDYNHPDPEGAPKPRTRTDHDAWWEKNLPGVPAPEETPQAPADPEGADTPPETASGAPEQAESPAVGEQDAPPEPPAPQPVYEIPEDNGHRSDADTVLREAGPDELFEWLRKQPTPEVIRELQARGCQVQGEHKPDALRRWLGGIVIRRTLDDTAPPTETTEPQASDAKTATRKPRR